ncbi:MAG: uncharacterized protein K0R93_718 [Anaerosolibacter sp.]|jgi:hypothetical protein|uniref:hypothetical protein n=1 Tax=Anaerosolibacter sp. TaxID=1872527 RepID=UPI0026164B76|nr:hypothetical protein [Anaerosolibacter sp.]MDF2545820.1 uncharacterized protein [Anaerosolibacter sp.]
MTKIDWMRKLSSRKFWSLLMALIAAGLVLVKVEATVISQVSAVIGAFSSVVIYILAEANVDGKRVETPKVELIDNDDTRA